MKTCYCCGLNEDQYEDEPLGWFELQMENTDKGVDIMDIEAHASCFDFFKALRPDPLRAERNSTLRPMEEATT